MPYESIELDVREGVAHLTLNRPEAANCVDAKMAGELMHAALHCDEDPRVRAVLLSGRGAMFSGGGDLKSFSELGDELPFYLKETTTALHAAISRLSRCQAPVVCAVHGAAAGGGFSLACACDIVLAAESARFTMAYTKAGLTPDGSSTYFLPRLVGLRRALELALTNRTLSAAEAVEWGLATRVIPDRDLASETEKLAAKLAQGPTVAYGSAKRLLRGGGEESLETQMELESRAIADITRTEDAREGVRSFLEKRTPNFRGR